MHHAYLVFVKSAIPLTLAELSKISHLPGIVQVFLRLNHCRYCHWIVIPRFIQMLAFPWIYSKVWSFIFAYWITAPASLSLSYASCHPVLHDRLLARGNLAFYEDEALVLLVGWLLRFHIFIASGTDCISPILILWLPVGNQLPRTTPLSDIRTVWLGCPRAILIHSGHLLLFSFLFLVSSNFSNTSSLQMVGTLGIWQ